MIGQLRLPQIEFVLDPAPRFIGELAGAEKFIGPPALGANHQKFDFVMQLGKLFVPVVAVFMMLGMFEPGTMLGAQRRDDAIRKGTLCGKLVEPGKRGFDGLASGSALLSFHAAALAPACMRKTKRTNHKRQSEPLSDKRYQNYRECQKARRTKARTLCPLASSNAVRLRPIAPRSPAAPVTRIGLSCADFIVISLTL